MDFASLMKAEVARKRKYIEDKNVLKVCDAYFFVNCLFMSIKLVDRPQMFITKQIFSS